MTRRVAGRLAVVFALTASALAVGTPASAVQLEDLGIDLGDLLGKGRRADGFSLAESILQRELPRRVGPAARYDVRLDRAGSDLLRGRLSRVDISGIDVRTRDGLVIPKMDLRLEGVRLGLGSRSLDQVAKSVFSAALGEDAVSRYVRKRGGPKVRDAEVAFRDGQIVVRAVPELLGLGLPSEVAGKPVLNGSDSVDFRASRLSILGVRLPRVAVSALEREINPVVDLSGLKLPVRITELAIRGDRLVADGTASFGRR